MIRLLLLATALLAATPATAAEVSTHVLDLARGRGGPGVPVTLSRKGADGTWQRVASATTDADGRVRRIGDAAAIGAGTWRLDFDLSRYPDASAAPFFPEISVTFRVTDPAGHYHVPVTLSPYGYSTYRGT